jgi:hypothetical protein
MVTEFEKKIVETATQLYKIIFHTNKQKKTQQRI